MSAWTYSLLCVNKTVCCVRHGGSVEVSRLSWVTGWMERQGLSQWENSNPSKVKSWDFDLGSSVFFVQEYGILLPEVIFQRRICTYDFQYNTKSLMSKHSCYVQFGFSYMVSWQMQTSDSGMCKCLLYYCRWDMLTNRNISCHSGGELNDIRSENASLWRFRERTPGPSHDYRLDHCSPKFFLATFLF